MNDSLLKDNKQLHLEELRTELRRTKKSNTLSVFFVNIRSMRKYFTELTTILSSLPKKFDFIILNETCLTENEEAAYGIGGYTSYSAPRDTNGGGLIIYANNNLNHSIVKKLSHNGATYESLFIRVKLNTSTYTIGTVYRPPSTSVKSFNEEFKVKVLQKLNRNETVICGAFNLNLLGKSTQQLRSFVTNLNSLNLNNVIKHPTRVTESTSTLIDQVWTSSHEIKLSSVLD